MSITFSYSFLVIKSRSILPSFGFVSRHSSLKDNVRVHCLFNELLCQFTIQTSISLVQIRICRTLWTFLLSCFPFWSYRNWLAGRVCRNFGSASGLAPKKCYKLLEDEMSKILRFYACFSLAV